MGSGSRSVGAGGGDGCSRKSRSRNSNRNVNGPVLRPNQAFLRALVRLPCEFGEA